MMDELNKRVKNLDAMDIVLTKWAAIFAALIIIKIFPGLLSISYWILFIVLIVLAARPAYKFFKS
jgi:hypothetical protein